MTYSRPDKGSHLETIKYEIDMLSFCYEAMQSGWNKWKEPKRNLYLEGFLLHYRNLLGFFSGRERRDTDLTISRPTEWSPKADIEEAELELIKTQTEALHNKYWQDVSQYLQHCTVRRHKEKKSWNPSEMFAELQQVVTRFQKLVKG